MRRVLALATVALTAVALGACGGGDDGGGSKSGSAPPKFDSSKPVTVTIWHPYTQREKKIFEGVLADFQKAHPSIKVKSVSGINDDKITASIRGGNPPDVAFSNTTDNVGAFCGSGGWIDLQPYIDRDKVDLGTFPKAVQSYTQFGGKRCAMPMLADVYGLYYNKALFKKAGISAPPKTVSELTADAKKLTEKNSDGSIKVAGFVPSMGFYEHVHAHYAPSWNAQWTDSAGHSTLGKDPHWADLLRWDRDLIDWYGYDKLTRFQASAGEEFSASNGFETGKIAMMLDGEWRTAFLKDEHPEVQYGTAPFPVDDNQPELYGGGYVVGNILGIPKGAKQQAAAWELIKYLTTDDQALVTLANGLGNVPTTRTSLKSPDLHFVPQFKTFLDVYADPHTQTNPATPIGSANQELFQNFIGRWQAGHVPDSGLESGLDDVDKQIDAQVANTTAGQKAP
jgi:multiple sugar transport system substrate-binding protein